MKANEYRIGNYVNDVGSMPFKVAAACIVALVQCEAAGKINIGYNPIQLDENWLIKLGFKYQKPGAGGQDQWAGFGWWHLDKGEFSLIGTKSGNVWFGRCNDWKINFVHELQNLYFSLEKKELTLKQ